MPKPPSAQRWKDAYVFRARQSSIEVRLPAWSPAKSKSVRVRKVEKEVGTAMRKSEGRGLRRRGAPRRRQRGLYSVELSGPIVTSNPDASENGPV